MARTRGEGPVTLSVLDRLIDDEPRVSEEAPMSRSESVKRLKTAVRRDLEWLLNTRAPVDIPPGEHSQKSVYMYGLPDFAAMSLSSIRDREKLTQAIEVALANFEPRLANVRVTMARTSDERVPQLRFVIEGMLRVDPSPEHVSFDTLLELSSREYKVQGEAGAR